MSVLSDSISQSSQKLNPMINNHRLHQAAASLLQIALRVVT